MRRLPGEDIYGGKITLEEADEDQSDLADKINEFKIKRQDRKVIGKNKKEKLLKKTCIIFLKQEK